MLARRPLPAARLAVLTARLACAAATLGILVACAPRGPENAEAASAEPITVERSAPFGTGALHYLDRGAGARAVVLVHGWASDSRVWREELERSPAGRRVIAVDLPGHGGSDEPRGPHSMDLYADAIAAVLDHAGVEQGVLVGHSNGTPTVRQFYRRHPERTLALVAVDGPLRRMFDPAQAEPFLAAFRGEGWQQAVAGFVDSMPAPALPVAIRDEVHEMAMAQSQRTVVGGLEAALDETIWTDDPIEVPLLVLLAEQPSWTSEYETAVRALSPSVDYRVWGDGTGHFLMLEQPDAFHASLDEFLSAHRLP
jgi:pimeloyl-ACP methyl ester carboxylesterase